MLSQSSNYYYYLVSTMYFFCNLRCVACNKCTCTLLQLLSAGSCTGKWALDFRDSFLGWSFLTYRYGNQWHIQHTSGVEIHLFGWLCNIINSRYFRLRGSSHVATVAFQHKWQNKLRHGRFHKWDVNKKKVTKHVRSDPITLLPSNFQLLIRTMKNFPLSLADSGGELPRQNLDTKKN